MPGELDLLAITRDITSRKANEDLVWKQANFDPLTELRTATCSMNDWNRKSKSPS